MRKRKTDKRVGTTAKDPKVWVPLMHKRYAQTGRLIQSCRDVKLGWDLYSTWRKKYPWVQEAHEHAEAMYVEKLEQELHRRGVEGVPRPQMYKGEVVHHRDPETGELKKDDTGEPIPVVIREYSDRLLELELKARAPEKYRENQRSQGDDVARVLVVPTQAASVDEWMEKQRERKANAA